MIGLGEWSRRHNAYMRGIRADYVWFYAQPAIYRIYVV
jgi:hypothetical protein